VVDISERYNLPPACRLKINRYKPRHRSSTLIVDADELCALCSRNEKTFSNKCLSSISGNQIPFFMYIHTSVRAKRAKNPGTPKLTNKSCGDNERPDRYLFHDGIVIFDNAPYEQR
jgi:hypothetical protein